MRTAPTAATGGAMTQREGITMSDTDSNRLLTTFFTVSANAFARAEERDIVVHVNDTNRNIVTLEVGGLRITTDRDNWGAIFKEFAAVLSGEVVAMEQARTVRVAFDDANRTADLKLVTE